MIRTRKHLDYTLGYIELGLFPEAREELSRIKAADRKKPAVIAVLLELAMAEEIWSAVITLAPQVSSAYPAKERPWIAWAYALRERGQIAEARDILLRGAAAIPKPSILVDYNLACYFCLLGDLAEARRRLDMVFARDPDWKKDAREDPDLAALHTPKKH